LSQLRAAVVRCEKLVAEVEGSWEARARGISALGSHYQATAIEDSEDFMCVIVTVIFGMCNSVKLS
jgi:hypothetical protein